MTTPPDDVTAPQSDMGTGPRPLSKSRQATPIKTLDPRIRPWERQPGEPDRAWAAFQIFRDAGEDRQIGLALGGRDPKQGSRWAYQWQWRQRVEAYDRHLDAIRVRGKRREVERMVERHASLANGALGALQQPVAEVIRRIQDKSFSAAKMSDKELLQFIRQSAAAIKELVAVERVSRGVPSDATVTGDLSDGAPGTIEKAMARILGGDGPPVPPVLDAGPLPDTDAPETRDADDPRNF